jgi:hypothetical protein
MWTVIAAIVVAGLLGSLTDWLFMGLLFHDAYNRYPEVWRSGVREGKARGAIILSSVLGFVMSAGVVALCAVAGVNNLRGGLEVAFLAWLAGPPVVIIVGNMFVKMDAKITFAHCLGYLARMAIAGAAAGLILPLA